MVKPTILTASMLVGGVVAAVTAACSGGGGAGVTSTAVIATQSPVQSPAPPSAAVSPMPDGEITGILSYPSSFLPEDLDVCAREVDGERERCTQDRVFDDVAVQYSYRLKLPPGNYLVYARSRGLRAYYSEYVRYGLRPDCPSHLPVVVTVESGSTARAVDPGDWYAPSRPRAASVEICANESRSHSGVSVNGSRRQVMATPLLASLIVGRRRARRGIGTS